jgi:hypothetical protein
VKDCFLIENKLLHSLALLIKTNAMKKLILLSTFYCSVSFSQELPAVKNCHDTTAFNGYHVVNVTMKNSTCNLGDGRNHQYYFSTGKDFPGFNGDQICFSQFNTFDLKKHNIVLLEYDYKTTKIHAEVKTKDGKAIVIVRVVKPKGNSDLLIPKPYHKFIEIPKEMCKEKPQIIICETTS